MMEIVPLIVKGQILKVVLLIDVQMVIYVLTIGKITVFHQTVTVTNQMEIGYVMMIAMAEPAF